MSTIPTTEEVLNTPPGKQIEIPQKRPAMHKGQIVEIEGGKFRIHSIGKMILIEPMPGTYVEKFDPSKALHEAANTVKEAVAQRNNLVKLIHALLKRTGGYHEIPAAEIDGMSKSEHFETKFDESKKLVILKAVKIE
jgi:hypothetical protein